VDLVVTSPPYFGLRDYGYDGQIGSEGTPGEWLEALWACTREWVRVLKPEGSLFVNLGDKYDSGTSTPRINPGTVKDGQGQGWHLGTPRVSLGHPKSLLGLPWRYAIGCMDRLGLILRAEIVWAKPNGLPESVTDRVRRAHEQVFHFTRQPRYYAAVDEIRVPHDDKNKPNGPRGRDGASRPGFVPAAKDGLARSTLNRHTSPEQGYNPLGKLPGSVWEIPSAPLQVPARLGVDHFAAFPPALVRPIVLGWSPPGVCTACGQGRRPVVDRSPMVVRPSARRLIAQANGNAQRTATGGTMLKPPEATITGYACACPEPDAPTRPAVVLDPFGGTGTTALVASAYGRHGITVDLSAAYCRLAAWRVHDPGERARARAMPKPAPVPDGMEPLFTM
jgi:DNA modification methylase